MVQFHSRPKIPVASSTVNDHDKLCARAQGSSYAAPNRRRNSLAARNLVRLGPRPATGSPGRSLRRPLKAFAGPAHGAYPARRGLRWRPRGPSSGWPSNMIPTGPYRFPNGARL